MTQLNTARLKQAATALLFSTLAAASSSSAATTQIFSIPGAKEMTVTGINASGTVIGACYRQACGRDHGAQGYIRTIAGNLTEFAVPHARATTPARINDGEAIVGHYTTADGYDHGFLRSPIGSFTTIDAAGFSYTYPSAINNRGDIAGSYYSPKDIYPHAFVRDANGTVTTFDVPGAAQTYAAGITLNGEIVGSYAGEDYVFRGYVRAADGTLTTFDVPDSAQIGRLAINSKGTVAGSWEDLETLHWHAFVRAPGGNITTFDVPDSLLTEAEDINARGEIVGQFIPQTGAERAFLRTPDGKFISISGRPHTRPENAVINRYGVIAGGYGPRRSMGVGGFIRTR